MYNAMLSIYYLLTVRYGWKENQLKKLEKYFFGIPIVFGLATAVAGVALKLFNNANLWCWISPLPLTCRGSLFNNGINDCERGNNASLYRFLFFYGPLWFVIITASIAMFLLYTSVRKTEQQAAKWSLATRLEKTARLKHSQKVRRQAFFYLMAFYVAWLPGTMLRTIQTINTSADTSVLLFIFAITGPFQGTLNFLVYVRPKYLKYRRKHPENLCLVIQMIVFTCCMKEEPSGDITRITEPIVESKRSILAELKARTTVRKTIPNEKSYRKRHNDEESAQSSKIPNEESHDDEESKKMSQIPNEESHSDEESKQSFKIPNREGRDDEGSANVPLENSQDHPMEDSHNDSSGSFVEND
uniref:G-protein coupled receptors family 1 profile domain-containing protein n=1 Tax=Ditylum brightwellii TaxID=49249 RepID=A0A7S4SJ42_9STRA